MGDSYETEQLIAWAACSEADKWCLLVALHEIRELPEVDMIESHSLRDRHRATDGL